MAGKKRLVSNRIADRFIVSGALEIDADYASERLQRYLHELDLLESGGATIKELFAEKKEAQKPVFIPLSEEHDSQENIEEIPHIAKLTLSGVMRMESDWCTRGVDALCQDIERCNENSNTMAILIEANSGGGESLSGQLLQNAIADSKIPVIVYAHFLGSAAVRGTLPADYVFASGPSTRVGSIGTYVSINNRVIEWYNANITEIYAEGSEDKNKEFRELLKGNVKPIQAMVTESAEIFRSEVQKHRELKGDVSETLRGGMFPAMDALERGLVDGIGTFQDAINKAIELSNQSKNSTAMLGNIAKALKSKFGLNVSENATQEEIERALEEAPSLEEREEEIIEQARTAATEAANAAIQTAIEGFQPEAQEVDNSALIARIEALEAAQEGFASQEDLEATQSLVEENQTTIQAVSAANEAATAENQRLSEIVAEDKAKIKGKRNGKEAETTSIKEEIANEISIELSFSE